MEIELRAVAREPALYFGHAGAADSKRADANLAGELAFNYKILESRRERGRLVERVFRLEIRRAVLFRNELIAFALLAFRRKRDVYDHLFIALGIRVRHEFHRGALGDLLAGRIFILMEQATLRNHPVRDQAFGFAGTDPAHIPLDISARNIRTHIFQPEIGGSGRFGGRRGFSRGGQRESRHQKESGFTQRTKVSQTHSSFLITSCPLFTGAYTTVTKSRSYRE